MTWPYWSTGDQAQWQKTELRRAHMRKKELSEAKRIKTKFMIFGPLPESFPHLLVYDEPIEPVASFKHVGYTFNSTKKNIFIDHYVAKAIAAHNGITSFFILDSVFATIWPKLDLQLSMARV
uniref:Uncharacterized protein n=1 Tax=Psilocybe cubensis TaxID=181762 RepID=A0A8H7XZJ4_PSICU